LIKYALSYIKIHLHVSVTFATTLMMVKAKETCYDI